MTQHNATDLPEQLTTTAHVPLSERPLVAEDERTVITVPEQSRVDARNEMTPVMRPEFASPISRLLRGWVPEEWGPFSRPRIWNWLVMWR